MSLKNVTKNVPFLAHIFYCSHCDVPVITSLLDIDEVKNKGLCPLCGGETKYLSTDLRPVFPQERLLLELLLGLKPLSLSKKSLWCEKLKMSEIIIDVPNHSQSVRLDSSFGSYSCF